MYQKRRTKPRRIDTTTRKSLALLSRLFDRRFAGPTLPEVVRAPGRMALFAVNTGLRESNVCGLEWAWEVPVPEVGRSVFVIPPEAFKSKRAHVVILNDAAWSIVEAQRGLDPIWVFPHRGRRMSTMNKPAWQRARREADLRAVRIHDLRHTFARRLHAAGVPAEDRDALLGCANRSMAGHYASADLRLLKLVNFVLNRQETCTVLRLANAEHRCCGQKVRQGSRRRRNDLTCCS